MANYNEMGIDMDRRNAEPRPLTDHERERLEEFLDSIHYSSRYNDSEYEYRHVQLPKAMLKAIPKEYHDSSKGTLKLLWEEEWRGMGITQISAKSRREKLPGISADLNRRPLNYQPPAQ
ncbi:hypothetical protein PpBr36_08464 [Pyricularia pennisetigena]|uniref:hypothetical protein n=1 Tax=Pyricularia pennisetigena TaxID=1578925 RepID=UPI00114E9F90|nr:hypothetical protein PpBr36_08464 [Pyricularia pennisetigena]TLS24228.1 hypothetical protein PpBr36_08464 [Pyricularia pennisetigena]